MPDDIEDDLQEAFRAEAEENLQLLTSGLLELEEDGADAMPETIEAIYRASHSLKGAARAVANWPLEEAAAAWEVLFSAWKRAGSVPPDAPFDLLQEMLSQVPPLVEDPAAAEAERLHAALEQLHQWGDLAAGASHPSQPPRSQENAPHPGPAEPGSADPAASSAVAEEEKPRRREATIRISHERLNELVNRADEALAVKISARSQAMALRGLSESFQRIRGQLVARGDAVEGPAVSGGAAAVLLDHFHEELRQIVREADQHVQGSARAIDELREKTQAAFMRPVSTLLDIFPKTVRDLSRSQGKRVELSMSGGHLAVDQRVLEGLTDPLLHLVRNAVDHGIERPEERTRAGKEEKGRLQIAASQPHPGRIDLVVRDDGAGLPLQALREAAVARGLLKEEDAVGASPEVLTALIFESGFSTRGEISPISGRGLGLAIVRDKVERLGGQVSVRSDPGQGTVFLISLPSTLVVFRGLSLKVAGETFVLPVGQVEAVAGFRSDQLVSTQDAATLRYGDQRLPLVDLTRFLQLPHAAEPKGDALRQAVIVRSASDRAALIVDEILREDDFSVRPFNQPLVRVRGILGAAVLPSGQLLPILQVADLLEAAFHWVTPEQSVTAPVSQETAEAPGKRILVADDSITSRALLKNILEAAGYRVVLAIDGREALSALRLQPVDLVVSDVEMPRMNGFQLTKTIREDPALRELPVILVTALATTEDRKQGLESGANHYIVKTDFEQGHLLEAVQRLL